VGNRDDPDGVTTNDVGNVMRTDAQVDSAIALGSQPRNLRVAQNPIRHRCDLLSESPPEARLLGLVMEGRLCEFFLRLSKDD
jgi:hypothetical protein